MVALVKIPAVQTWAVQRITAYLSDELQTTVSIDAVEFHLFRSIALRGLYIEDLKHDTLLYAPVFDAKISGFNFSRQSLVISAVDLKNAHINLRRYKEATGLNIDFLADYFSTASSDTNPSDWDIKVTKVNLENAVFSYRDFRWDDATPCIDFEDMLITNLNLQASDITPKGDSLIFTINKMEATEKSGFVLSELTGKFTASGHHLGARSLKVLTPNSKVYGDVRLNFDSWDDFNYFIPKVKLETSFALSKVASEDLKYFSSELIGLKKTVSFKGDILGTVDNLKGKNLQIIYSPRCFFKGNLSMNGLPEIDETFIDMMATDLRLNKKDVESFPVYPFESGDLVALPENLSALGTIQFKGKFTGFYNDFVAYGTATTALGFVSSDINFKLGNGKVPAAYSGNLVTHKFDIGKLLKVDPQVGEITAKVKVKGKGLALVKLDADLVGEVSSFTVRGYQYSGIKVNGHVSRRLFTGKLNVADPNVDLDFNGTVDYSKSIPAFDFTANVRNAMLGKLHLIDDETANFSTSAELHCTGNKIDNLEGTLQFTNTNYLHLMQGITINNLYLSAATSEDKRNILLESDFADATMSGDFLLSSVFRSATFILSKYIPAIPVNEAKEQTYQSFDYQVRLKETRGVLDVLIPELSILAGTKLEGNFDTRTGNFSALLKSDEIIYNGIRFSGLNVSGITENNSLRIYLMNKEMQVNDSLSFTNVVIAGLANRDSADINLVVANSDSSLSRLNWGFSVKFLPTGYTTVKLLPYEFVVERNEWKVDPTNYKLFDDNGMLISNYIFSSGNQRVAMNGIIGKDSSSTVSLNLKEFNTSLLRSMLNIYDADIGGVANGKIIVTSLLKDPVIESDLSVKDLSWFGDTLGDADVVTDWNTSKNKIEINGFVTRGGEKNIAVNGEYIIKEKGDEILFDIEMHKTYIKSFSHYLTGIFSDLSGIASGKFKLYGLAIAPQLTGMVHLQKVGFRVDYLNTYYNFSADVNLDEDEITFDDVVVNDRKGSKAVVSGKVTHDHLRDFYFDINIAAQKFQLMNTTYKDNDLYYGMAYGSGNINISGYLDYIKMDIAMRSEKGTQISIPLNNPAEVSRSSFITFMKTDTLAEEQQQGNVDISGLEINLDLDVTTDANIKLIFDDKIGDVIEGNGSGTIKMKVNDADGFLMYGNYYIERGQYTFTLQNVISKPFTIEKGGSISWTGDPYDADVAINAVYSKLRVNLYDLLQDTSSGYKKPIPVVLRLQLTGKLFNPVIGFDIEVPNIDATTASRIQRYISSDEQKFKQAVSLLILRRFSPPDELANRPPASTSGAVGANAYEFLSNQLSNWASQIDENINVGINYNPGTSLTQEELELALSTSLFNDFVTLETNVGVAGSNTGTPQNTSNIVGDFSVDVKARKDGKVRLKAFNRSNNNSLINNLNSQYTQGIGIFYREEFNSLGELRQRWRDKHRKNKRATEEGSNK